MKEFLSSFTPRDPGCRQARRGPAEWDSPHVSDPAQRESAAPGMVYQLRPLLCRFVTK